MSKRMTIADFDPDVQAKLRKQLAETYGPKDHPNLTRPSGPNVAEQTVLSMLGFGPHHFESRAFAMSNGHVYTADAFDGRRVLEVKGFKHGSYGRSRLAFDQCRVEFPDYQWIWAERKKTGKKGDRWVFEVYGGGI